jgi:hypothetical protein
MADDGFFWAKASLRLYFFSLLFAMGLAESCLYRAGS